MQRQKLWFLVRVFDGTPLKMENRQRYVVFSHCLQKCSHNIIHNGIESRPANSRDNETQNNTGRDYWLQPELVATFDSAMLTNKIEIKIIR